MLLLFTNPILDAYRGSDIFGKAIFLSLFLLSIVTWILFIQKLTIQRTIHQRGKQFLQLIQKKRSNPLGIEIGDAVHPFAAIYRTLKEQTLEVLQKNQMAAREGSLVTLSSADIALIDTQLLGAVTSEIKQIEKNLFILATIVSLAPFLGLLGTVWGILVTFVELQTGGGTASIHSTAMGGIAMALGTTVIGLLVAIPALIGYNYLKARTAYLEADLEDFSHHLLSSIELHYRQVDVR